MSRKPIREHLQALNKLTRGSPKKTSKKTAREQPQNFNQRSTEMSTEKQLQTAKKKPVKE
ncbi:10108_t:CDS:1, partial [Gigaspora margarita]